MNNAPERRLELLRWMMLARALDERLGALYRQGGIRGGSVFLGKGQEAFSAATALQLRRWTPERPGDLFAPLIRDLAGRLAFGEEVIDGMRTYLGRSTGPMRGREGNIHRGNLHQGQLPMISHLGASVAPVCGMLMARRQLGRLDETVGVVSVGDGAMNTGACHEGLNIAAVERLPLVVLVADNQVAYSTFSDRTYACRTLADRAAGYGFAAHELDGTDADACLAVCGRAVAAARAGQGPQMVVARLLRLAGHGEHDDGSYVPAELKARFGDCLPLFERRLLADGAIDEAGLARRWEQTRELVAASLAQAQSEPEPDPAHEDWSAVKVRNLVEFLP